VIKHQSSVTCLERALAGGSREQRNKMAGARAQRGKDAVYAGCKLEPLTNARSGGCFIGEGFSLGGFWVAPFFFSLPTFEFALFGLEPTFAVRNASILGIARFKLLSVGRVASEHGDLCNEHTKGQQRAVSSTFRVLTQAQYQTRAVAAKEKPSRSGC